MPILGSFGSGSIRGFRSLGRSFLYPFTSHTFTNCGATGKNGPTLAQMKAAYSGQSWAQDSNFFLQGDYQGLQKWKVPASGSYKITALGAAGGYAYYYGTSSINAGGAGARVVGTFVLDEGEFLVFLVGQMGRDNPNSSRGAGGGGGSFIYRLSNSTLLMAAGGGGGAGQYAVSSAGHGQSGSSGGNGTIGTFGSGGTSGAGGGASAYAGGGAGWNSNGTNSSYGTGGTRFLAGGLGGNLYSDGGDGGFGGGAGSYAGSGGGGGYSGGGGGGWSYSGFGGGGGSYGGIATAAINSGHGSILVELL